MESITPGRTNTSKERAVSLMGLICRILKWNEMQYADFQYEMGLAYLNYYLPTFPEGVELIVRERMFWNWWKSHWMNRDEAFSTGIYDAPQYKRVELYRGLNDPETLATQIYPNGVILGECFARVITAQQQTA